MMSFTHLIVGVTHPKKPEIMPYRRTHKRIGTIRAFDKVQFNGLEGLLNLNPVEINVNEIKIVILEKVVDDS